MTEMTIVLQESGDIIANHEFVSDIVVFSLGLANIAISTLSGNLYLFSMFSYTIKKQYKVTDTYVQSIVRYPVDKFWLGCQDGQILDETCYSGILNPVMRIDQTHICDLVLVDRGASVLMCSDKTITIINTNVSLILELTL